MKIKKGDLVIIKTGKDRGQQGKVLRVFPADQRVIVEGRNLQKQRQRSRQEGKKGQTLSVAAPLSAANVLLLCANCGRGVRVGMKLSGQSKTRVCRKCGKEI